MDKSVIPFWKETYQKDDVMAFQLSLTEQLKKCIMIEKFFSFNPMYLKMNIRMYQNICML